MSEPPRLLQEAPGSLERALLEAGSSYRTSPGLHAKTLAAVGIAGSAAATSLASASLSQLGWPKWLTALSVMGASAAIPVSYYVLSDPAPVSGGQAPARTPPRSEPHFIEPAPLEEPKPLDEPAPLEVKPAPAKPRAEARVQRNASLVDETQAVEVARRALARGDTRSVFAALDSYSRTYPRGRLALEAEVLRIAALDESGQRESARRRAESFLRSHPKSVLSSRVRRVLDH
jgi:hypothetical protein